MHLDTTRWKVHRRAERVIMNISTMTLRDLLGANVLENTFDGTCALRQAAWDKRGNDLATLPQSTWKQDFHLSVVHIDTGMGAVSRQISLRSTKPRWTGMPISRHEHEGFGLVPCTATTYSRLEGRFIRLLFILGCHQAERILAFDRSFADFQQHLIMCFAAYAAKVWLVPWNASYCIGGTVLQVSACCNTIMPLLDLWPLHILIGHLLNLDVWFDALLLETIAWFLLNVMPIEKSASQESNLFRRKGVIGNSTMVKTGHFWHTLNELALFLQVLPYGSHLLWLHFSPGAPRSNRTFLLWGKDRFLTASFSECIGIDLAQIGSLHFVWVQIELFFL